MNDQNRRHARLRNIAAGALAALAAAGALAVTAALAANPGAKPHGHAAVVKGGAVKTPAHPVPGKSHAPQPGSSRPFLAAAQRLVNDGAISTAEGQVLDREILAGRVDTDTLASSGFTQTQLEAVQQALVTAKRALAPNVH